MNNNYKLLLFSLFCSTIIMGCKKEVKISDSQSGQFVKMFGSYQADEGRDVKLTDDGGYIFVGTTTTISKGTDISLIKTDKFGNEEWNKTFGDTLDDFGNSVQTLNDGFLILGTTTTTARGLEMYLIKTDKTGNEVWIKTFGTSSDEEGNYAQQTNDKGFILVGSTTKEDPTIANPEGTKDVYVVKTDASGLMEWENNYGAEKNDNGTSLQQTNDGGYVIVGSTESFQTEPGKGLSDILMFIINQTGGISGGYKTFGGTANDFGESVILVNQGFLVTGTTSSMGSGGSDIYLLKTSLTINDIQWEKTFGGSSNEGAGNINITSDGGYILCGFTESEGEGSKDQYLIKTDDTGVKSWTMTYGGTGSDIAKSVVPTTDGGYVITGSSEFENNQMISLIKTSDTGSLINTSTK